MCGGAKILALTIAGAVCCKEETVTAETRFAHRVYTPSCNNEIMLL